MQFPGSPVNGQQAVVNNIVYQYSSADSAWKRVPVAGVGYTGSQGATGYTGSYGDKGDTGNQGYTGSQGTAGTAGYTGSAGVSGYTGSQGNIGYTGSNALKITSSATPPANPNVGDIWYNTSIDVTYQYIYDGNTYYWVDITGSTVAAVGYTGSQGPAGTTGYTGSAGTIGYTGSAGAGYTGSSGYTGSTGATGYTGSSGAYAAVGYTGSAGAVGYTGSAGTGGGGGAVGYSFSGNTANNTETELFLDGINNSRYTVTSGATVGYEINIVGRKTDGTAHAFYKLQGLVANISGNVSDVGNLTETIFVRTYSDWLVDARADNTNKTLNIYVQGSTSNVVVWSASMTTTKAS